MMLRKILCVVGLLMIVPSLSASLPGEGPRLGTDRITQVEVEFGKLSLHDIRAAGLKMFSTPFNKSDGYGDGPMNPLDTTTPGGRPTLQNNGTFLRVNGLDGQSCLECHSIVSNATIPATLGIGGVGGSVTNAIFQPTFLDVSDMIAVGEAAMNGRFINPPFLFGTGGIELLAREMTADLQALKALAQANPRDVVSLDTKGVNFGEISFDALENEFDVSNVEGIDADLVVRPFGRKGEFATVRSFDEGAMLFHFGMQPVEIVGENEDGDGDGVVNEVLVGEMSALVIFNTTLERPTEDRRNQDARKGLIVFESIGCDGCHVRRLETDSRWLTYSYPEELAVPSNNVYFTADLSLPPANFSRAVGGGLEVPLFADLKRHDMGPYMEESFDHELDPMFTTARLWGVADTAPYMHDGRALTLGEAILMHGGEAQAARDAFAALPEQDQSKLLQFLHTLRTPRNPVNDLKTSGQH
jgi:hypothetical protein